MATRWPLRSRYTAILLTAVVGTVLTIAAFLLACTWDYRVATIDFQSKARSYLEFMNADLGDANAVMYDVAAFIGANKRAVDADEFATFAAAMLKRVGALRDAAWAPHVTLAERPKFERDARAAGIAGFQIKQFGAHGELFRAPPRTQYYALLYNQPDSRAARGLIGLDLFFEKRRAAAMRRALRTDRPAATPPLDILTVNHPGGGMLAYMPVYRRNTRSRGRLQLVQGIVLGVFDIDEFVGSIIARHPAMEGLNLYLFNPIALPDRRVIYQTPGLPASGPAASEHALLAGAHWQSTIVVIDQHLGAIVTPTQPLYFLRMSLFGVTTLIVGLGVTAMSVAYLFALLQRTLQLEVLTTNLRATTEEVTRISLHDALTGMPNRSLFGTRVDQAVAQFCRAGPFAVLFLDLDRFKAVNDTFGHGTGDRLLCAVAARIEDCKREADMAARLGGDEFAILLADTADPALVSTVAHRLIERLHEAYTFDNQAMFIGVSIGAAIATQNTTAESILVEADLAMYEAKRAGSGNYRLFEERRAARTNDGRFLESPRERSIRTDRSVNEFRAATDNPV